MGPRSGSWKWEAKISSTYPRARPSGSATLQMAEARAAAGGEEGDCSNFPIKTWGLAASGCQHNEQSGVEGAPVADRKTMPNLA